MARNDEGEFELVLGNRQLISVFLIVVVLLGVFFSMGYIVGRNSGAGPTSASNPPKQIIVEHPAVASPPQTTPAEPPPSGTPQRSAEVKPSPEGPPATHAEKPAEAPPKTTPQKEAAKEPPAPAKVAKEPPPRETKPSPSGRASVTGEPPAGKYWQVVATSRPDAEIIAEALNKKGFHALLTPAPKDGVFRVLVGPVGDPSASAQTRSDLEASGFKNPIMRKY